MTSRVAVILHLQSLYAALRGIIIITPWIAYLFATDLVLSLLLPISYFSPTLVYNLSSTLAAGVWHGIQLIFTRVNGAQITFSGCEIPPGESALVIANHLAWTDFYMIQELAIQAGMLGRCRWFAKQQLKWVPFLGWGLWAMGMPLVSREWTKDKREMDRVFSGITGNEWPIWLISYSEATRYTPEKYAQTVQWCKANKKPIPKHTLYPRTKGFVTSVQQLRHAPHIRAVYNLTIAYGHRNHFHGAPGMWETLSRWSLSQSYRFHVHVERYVLQDLPEVDEELARWLEQRWIEKGETLEVLRDMLAKDQAWSTLGTTDDSRLSTQKQ